MSSTTPAISKIAHVSPPCGRGAPLLLARAGLNFAILAMVSPRFPEHAKIEGSEQDHGPGNGRRPARGAGCVRQHRAAAFRHFPRIRRRRLAAHRHARPAGLRSSRSGAAYQRGPPVSRRLRRSRQTGSASGMCSARRPWASISHSVGAPRPIPFSSTAAATSWW